MCGCNKSRTVPAPRSVPSAPRSLPSVHRSVHSAPFRNRMFNRGLPSVDVPSVDAPSFGLPVVDTSIWGPPLWKILHVASVFSTTDAQKEAFANLLAKLLTGIPCPDCSSHYNLWYSSHPVRSVTSSGHRGFKRFRIIRMSVVTWVSLVTWVLDLHNDVNTRRGLGTWTVDQVHAAYGSLADVRDAARSLEGVIGQEAFVSSMALLDAIGA